MAERTGAPKPDFRNGFSVRDLPDGGMVLGQVDAEDVILVRRGGEFFALGAVCTHYHGPLSDGLVVGDTVRCPWHHACFSLRTGEALRAPALDPISCWRVEKVGDKAFVREKLAQPAAKTAVVSAKSSPNFSPNSSSNSSSNTKALPTSVVIVGGGGAGLAAADMLRREGYDGTLTMISSDDSPPYDRPNLSKDFLAGTAPDDWIPLRSPEYYSDRRIDLVLGSRVSTLGIQQRQVKLENGKTYEFGALLIATGAEPIRLQIEGAADSQIHYLRTFADSRAIVAKAASAKRVVVVGASFIGLEVAASLRARGIDVDVVAPGSLPLERVMGPDVGLFLRRLHESHGVVFHLGSTVSRISGRSVTLSNGTIVDADFVVLGVGVRPSIALAEGAGLAIDRGIAVNEYLETSVPGIFAAGDVARWPDAHSGERIRVEHWVVAERQGQVAAKNILGQREPFTAVPFFWSQHYDVAINYVGHAENWDAVEIEGRLNPNGRDCAVTYKRRGRTLAVATISRDLQNLQAEAAMESE
jgi:NADPH-dependent 2,4-dienoyl-CoA reductase/sulfur reductase-like enzyme/nitrite reductase/ring-hydroxylating ferredoxin subunit